MGISPSGASVPQSAPQTGLRPYALLGLLVVAWGIAYISIEPLANWIAYDALTLPRQSQPGQAWWSVPAAVPVGIPLYPNAAGIVPIAGALIEKGASLDTVLALMMSVIRLSLSEMIILRRVLKPRLITAAIMATGYQFSVMHGYHGRYGL